MTLQRSWKEPQAEQRWQYARICSSALAGTGWNVPWYSSFDRQEFSADFEWRCKVMDVLASPYASNGSVVSACTWKWRLRKKKPLLHACDHLE